ncbi:MAG: tetratricopeptide repeat protein [Pirellulales bacterium]|nr:tetratricopeptide repeat protein [Pirellulales bacterium]
MILINGTRWLCLPAVAAWLALSGFLSPRCAAQDTFGGAPSKPSFTDSVKQSFSKVGEAFSSKPKTNSLPDDDPTLLKSEGKPSVDLYLTLAKHFEETNKPAQAEEQYQKALRQSPNHLAAMLGYAHFMENHGRYEDAVNLYQRTIKTHPQNASAHNNLGLCHARGKKLKEATAAIGQAVQLDPRNPLYRNNVAALLVEQNRPTEAFENLRSVHGDAKAYYNLGYLLSKKGDKSSAEHHFKQALRIDPTLEPAQRWLCYLQNKPLPPPADRNFKIVRPSPTVESARQPEHVATRILPPPSPPQEPPSAPRQNPFYAPRQGPAPNRTIPGEPPATTDPASPKRLPPVAIRQPLGSAHSLDASDSSEFAPAAPLPPGAN